MIALTDKTNVNCQADGSTVFKANFPYLSLFMLLSEFAYGIIWSLRYLHHRDNFVKLVGYWSLEVEY